MAAPDLSAKLQQLIQVSIDNAMVGVKEHITARVQDLQIQVGQLEVQLRTLNVAIADGAASKAKPRKKAAAEAPTTPTDATAAEVAAAEAVAPAAADGKKFPTNSYNWFTAKFKSDAEFRAKHLTPANLELMKTDEIIAKKKTDAEKITPQSKYLWAHYKAKDAAVNKQLNAQYEAEKEAHEKANKPAQQTKEEDSPKAAHK
jgi:pyruvate/2-oxoglutarate dehydrogenase complex dihydrolipoamide acyltransferase (E2) component